MTQVYRWTMPYALSLFVYAIAFGVAARAGGLSIEATIAMSATAFSGAAQLAALQLWAIRSPLALSLSSRSR